MTTFCLFFNYFAFAFGARARVRLPNSIPTRNIVSLGLSLKGWYCRVAASSEHNSRWQEESPKLPLRSSPPTSSAASALHREPAPLPTLRLTTSVLAQVPRTSVKNLKPVPSSSMEPNRPSRSRPDSRNPKTVPHLQTCGVAPGPVCGPRRRQLHIIHAQPCKGCWFPGFLGTESRPVPAHPAQVPKMDAARNPSHADGSGSGTRLEANPVAG